LDAVEDESLPHDLPLLRTVSEATRSNLLRHSVAHRVAAGTVLFEQGEIPNFQVIVLSGSVQLFGQASNRREVLIEVVPPPSLIIPAAVVTGAPYLMQARAPEASRLLMIHAAIFREAVTTDAVLAQVVIRSLAEQFRRMVRQIKNLKLRSAKERVGCYVLALSMRQGTPHRAVLPYEKNLIASELGITREAFSRTLSSLEDSGIRINGQTIEILDSGRLAAACMPDPLIDGRETF
jgi:CRP/FNR family transcriptional regulator, transcriptional activator FtrB